MYVCMHACMFSAECELRGVPESHAAPLMHKSCEILVFNAESLSEGSQCLSLGTKLFMGGFPEIGVLFWEPL